MDKQLINPKIDEIMTKYHVNSLVAKVIASKNLSDIQIKELLNDNLDLKVNKAKCVEQACERIKQAQAQNEKVFIAGDYDADGICATAIMKRLLDLLNIENGFYIPDRFKEGYGLNVKTVESAHKKGYTLIITVDNGVKASDALQKAKELGMSVIVTDHHIIDGEVNCDILVHHTLMDEAFFNMCGAATALQLANRLIGMDNLCIALAAIATIGDVMPLWHENRVIVKKGLSLMDKCPSIMALLEYRGKNITSTDIAFSLVPKLNAIGRMKDLSNPNNVVKYLLLEDLNEIKQASIQINNINKQRKQLSQAMYQTAAAKVDDHQSFLIIEDDSFHEGIVGLVAGRIANEQHKPCIVLSKIGDSIKGSGRSYGDFNMHEFFLQDFDYFEAFGGHSQAVGLTINAKDYTRFVEQVTSKMSTVEVKEQVNEETVILVDEQDLTVEEINSLNILDPYGEGFTQPLFAIKPTAINRFQMIKELYPKYSIRVGSLNMDAICFQTSNLKVLKQPQLLIGSLSVNEYKGQATPSLTIKDME